MKHLLFTLIFAGSVLAQTKPTIRQLTGPAGANPTVGIIAPDGTLTIATIGSGVTLVQNTDGTYTLSAATAALDSRTVVLTRSTDGSYTIPEVPRADLKVYRNGILQSALANPNAPGSQPDYTVLGPVIRPTTAAPWQPTDMITANYLR